MNPFTLLEIRMPSSHPLEDRDVARSPTGVAPVSGSVQQRENLLAAAARASRLLLQAPDVLAVMPDVLRLLGEAAEVDRTVLGLAETGPDDERYLVIKSEWIAGHAAEPKIPSERKSDCFCPLLKAGQSVYLCRGEDDGHAISIASDTAKSSMIVPFHVEDEYAGAVGFDDCRRTREFDPAVVSALEIAASVVGAAFHRQRLMDTVRREREAAAEQRVAELAKANAALRANLEQLASEPNLSHFLCHMLLEATRQLDAASGSAAVLLAGDEWHVMAHVRDGRVEDPVYPATARSDELNWSNTTHHSREPVHLAIDQATSLQWPGLLDYHRREGHKSVYFLPLVFGDRIVGFISLAFQRHDPIGSQQSELLVALALQATLAIGLKRLGISAKNAAVLAERNRIGQEIHDGLAQAFTGVLMQLGAVEEMSAAPAIELVLTRIRDIAREGLQEARRSVLALKPTEPRPGGLELALRQLAERSTLADRVACRFEGNATPTGLAPEHEHELLRIAQEAVSNAVRHGRPRTVNITLMRTATELSLSIADDGCGMEDLPELYAQQGFGMTNMRERAQAIGGDWRIESAPGQGTRVSVRITLRRNA
jgi:signal transduction histidine kinase